MHELILELVRYARPQPVLLRLPLDDGALVAAFDPHERGVRDEATPRWIAKTAYGSAGIGRLRAEARALGWLEPLAAALGTPRLLGWDAGGAGTGMGACLVQSGVGGRQATMPGSRRPGAPLPPSWRAAAQWLEAFQRLAAARWPRPPRLLAELGMEACAQAHAHARRRPELRELLSVLPPVVAQAAAAVAPSPTAVAIHGDFWSGNALLLPGGRDASALRVIDWSGFGQGSALDDLLTWVAYSDCPRGAARQARLPRWQRRFFGSGSERAFLRAGAGRAGYSAAAARLGFHLFLLRRLGWELGLGLQTRTPAEHDEARGEWAMMLAWLAEQGFPDPFESGAAERGRR